LTPAKHEIAGAPAASSIQYYTLIIPSLLREGN
jgi:hypothetical protein